ncbi:hypothetical protein HanXRQr2_Chr14g0626381 [Helianthus annuus]|uniref:Uncharacterized protein n=1 Tax=Helianthus annuus TaxID=4232 RepID=A0A9K3E653_HELAN|nr:hypothetical protein HanXRQr2_Chr14g0626381 [Helianthus annuus]
MKLLTSSAGPLWKRLRTIYYWSLPCVHNRSMRVIYALLNLGNGC